MKFFKNTIALFLLGVFVFNTVGYLIVYKSVQWQLKKQAKYAVLNNLDESFFIKKVFSKEEFATIEWEEDGLEIAFDNDLFDVLKIEEVNNEMVVYCINDKKENQLIAHLDNHINQHIANTHNSKGKSKNRASNKITKLFFEKKSVNINEFETERILIHFHPLIFASVVIETVSPPPQQTIRLV
jgi:hypothetical protein